MYPYKKGAFVKLGYEMRICYSSGIVTKPVGLKGLILSVRKSADYPGAVIPIKDIRVWFEDGFEWTFHNMDFEDNRDPGRYPSGNVILIGVTKDRLREANREYWEMIDGVRSSR